MNVILLEKIRNLGNLGEQVKVRAGYGRNFLIPHGKAVAATPENIEVFQQRRAELEQQANDLLAAAQARATQLSELAVSIAARAGDEGKLFGSVGARDIADAVTASGVKLGKQEVRLPNGPLRSVGEHQIDLQLHTDVALSIKVSVVAEA